MNRSSLAAVLATLSIAGAGVAAAAPADAAFKTPCAAQIKALSTAQKKAKKAKTPKAKAAAKKKATRAKAALQKCQATPKIILDKTTVPADDLLSIRVDAPEPKTGTHYRVAFYGKVPDDITTACEFLVKKDWADPNGLVFLSAILDGDYPVFCTGPGEVVLQTVPDDAPESYTGTSVARQTVTISAAATPQPTE